MKLPGFDQGGPSMHEHMMGTVRQPVPYHDVKIESVLGGFTFGRLQLGDLVLQLLLETAEFRDRALSYRGFNVGAGALALDKPFFGRVLGYNVKVDETDTVNIHAEDIVVAKAEDSGLGAIAVLAVIGPTQEDHTSGLHTETLHPCGRCRKRLADSPLMHEDTLVVTATPDFTVVEFASLSAITNLHENGNSSGITAFHFPATPAILRPREYDISYERPYATVEEIDSRDFDETIGLYLLQRRAERRNAGVE